MTHKLKVCNQATNILSPSDFYLLIQEFYNSRIHVEVPSKRGMKRLSRIIRFSRTITATIYNCKSRIKQLPSDVVISECNGLPISTSKLKGPSQPHLCFCLHARIWLLYFIPSLAKRRKITVKLLKIIKHTFRNTAYSKTIRIRFTMLYQ